MKAAVISEYVRPLPRPSMLNPRQASTHKPHQEAACSQRVPFMNTLVEVTIEHNNVSNKETLKHTKNWRGVSRDEPLGANHAPNCHKPTELALPYSLLGDWQATTPSNTTVPCPRALSTSFPPPPPSAPRARGRGGRPVSFLAGGGRMLEEEGLDVSFVAFGARDFVLRIQRRQQRLLLRSPSPFKRLPPSRQLCQSQL